MFICSQDNTLFVIQRIRVDWFILCEWYKEWNWNEWTKWYNNKKVNS